MVEYLFPMWKAKYEPVSADYVRVYEGNLAEILEKMTGPDDVPSGTKRPIAGRTRSPFEVNMERFSEMLIHGEDIFAFTFVDYKIDGKSPRHREDDYRYVDEPPEGWLTVEEVCQLKDVNKSAVTRAVTNEKIRCVMCRNPRKRYIAPDESLVAWKPRRQKDYLVRRWIILTEEVLRAKKPTTLDALFLLVARKEKRRYGGVHIPKAGIQAFLKKQLGSDFPESIPAWEAAIPHLLTTRYDRSHE